MTYKIKKGTSTYYRCEECGFYYEDKIWAKKCEDWCSRYFSCNTEIIKHAVKTGED